MEENETIAERADRSRGGRTAGETLKLAAAGLVAAAVIALVLQNQEPIRTEFLFWSAQTPRFALLGIVYLVGVASGWLLLRRRRRD